MQGSCSEFIEIRKPSIGVGGATKINSSLDLVRSQNNFVDISSFTASQNIVMGDARILLGLEIILGVYILLGL